MTKKHFVHDLADGHTRSSDLNYGYNKGFGNTIRKAVEYEDKYEELDSLPKKVRGEKGRFGWDRRDPSYRWMVQKRWLNAQVGRHIDDIRSEAFAISKKNTPAARMFRREFCSSWKGLNYRGKLKEINGALALVSADETHIYDQNMTEKDLYVNLKGILCYPDKKMVEHLALIRAKRYKEYYASQTDYLREIRGHYYFKVLGSWMEIYLAKAEEARGDYYGFHDYLTPPCVLCKKLGLQWREQGIFPYGKYCKEIRTLGKKEIRDLLLNN